MSIYCFFNYRIISSNERTHFAYRLFYSNLVWGFASPLPPPRRDEEATNVLCC